MADVLFIKANDRDQSVSIKLYDAFVNAYRAKNPGDNITELDLFEVELPYYNGEMFSGIIKLASGGELTAEEQKAVQIANRYTDQFIAADKVVIAFPLWNFTIPAQLLTYLSYLSQPRKTFKYTAQGPVGLQSEKKVVLLNARGSVYSEGPLAEKEMSVNYVKSMLGFWGITTIETVVVEGHNQFQDRAQQIIETGLTEAAKVASGF
ncbi:MULTISPECIES: FMN-dependent NADH-azoreductase [unclassified Paenibacillus]|uniref:FMN-dependent NADH-azoreductase n=1 Tax=unclassified Paenibacillus TaxID=185978 RepID=UPI000DC50B8E|nr:MULTISPECIES: FMN-dependent NADH-azoreductase [unclassified Paenibacillus]RAR42139.1 FMN-dependent NADH-azoreductase [Paenibacillus sp. MDMC362]